LVQGTEPQLARETVINGFPIRLPQLNIIAVGTGGGSIAAFDEGGGLNVGPRSAGAMPGPACYGLGGMVPTLTDANLALGRLGAALLGGRMHLDRGLAETVIGRLAERQGMSAIRLAEGIVAISVAKMSNAIREVSVKQGFDPRDFTLVAFGGAGPMHACFLAEDLGMREVVIPPHPGNVSAYGLLASDLRQDSVRTWIRSWPDLALAHLRAALAEQAAGLRSEVAAAGWPVSAADTSFAVDVRYLGQAFELTVPLPGDDQASLAQLPSLFEARHRVVYGHTHDRPLEIVNLRVALAVQKPFHFRLPPWNRRGAEEGKSRQVFLDGAWHEVPVLSRDGLQLGDRLAGPVIVAEAGSTTVIPHEWELSVAENGALLLAKAQARSAATASDLIGRSQS
jgi:N-methylhydantoinase A